MEQNLQYVSEEELGSERPTNQRLATEGGVVAVICLLVLKFGGFHRGGNPLSDIYEFEWGSALFTTAVVTLLYLAFRVWRSQALAAADEA